MKFSGLSRLRNRTFWIGMITGIALVFLAQLAINESRFPDRLIGPMLVDDSAARGDAIVVLGAGVIGDCVANLNGMRRAMLGARLFREGRAPLLVITGGAAKGSCPVADAMARVVREFGVPEDRLVLERQSRNTHENGEMTAPLLRERSARRILLVTDRLHMRRAAGVFQRLGFIVEPSSVPIYEGHINNVSMLSVGIREATALTYYRLRGWTGLRGADHGPVAASVAGDGRLEGVVKSVPVQTSGSSDRRPVVILGASYAAGWTLAEVDGVPVVNAGVAGQQSFEMLARFDADVVAAKPRAVVLWGFINDVFRADDPAKALARMRESYTEMIKRARARAIEPILATEVTIRPPKTLSQSVFSVIGPLLGKVSYQDRVNAQVIEINGWLRDLAQREGLLLIDLQAALAGTDGRRKYEFAVDDGSHISPEGYEALSRYARPVLSGRLRGSGAAPMQP
jgi:uncharacterized SAM-binding protein YcdF (DUF218 family)/lysophospholipase L1-like esterase